MEKRMETAGLDRGRLACLKKEEKTMSLTAALLVLAAQIIRLSLILKLHKEHHQ
jgi:hypothetical protein